MGTIAKLSPYQAFEIDAVEGWLDDMAQRGYRLESRSGGRFFFQETEPKNVRHRIDVRRNSWDNTDERKADYEEFGWEYVCALDSRLDIYRATRSDAVELNTDEETLREALEKSQQALKWTVIIGNILVLVLFLSLLWLVCREGFFHVLLTRSLPEQIVMVLWFLIGGFQTFREVRAYRAIKRRPLLQRTVHTRELEQKRRRDIRLDYILRLAVIALLAVNLVAGYEPRESIDLHASDYARYSIQQVLPEDAETNENEWAFWYDRQLCQEYSFGQFTRSGSRDYDVRIYETRWDWLARSYARETARLAGAEPITVPGHESGWFSRGKPLMYHSSAGKTPVQNVILLEGTLVIEISYLGPCDLRAAVTQQK